MLGSLLWFLCYLLWQGEMVNGQGKAGWRVMNVALR